MSELTDKLRATFEYRQGQDSRDGDVDDNYYLDAGRVLPTIEAVIALVGTAEQLIKCAAEFTHDMPCCSEFFQAVDEKFHDLEKVVVDGAT
jgi:hypothetical protein